MNNRDHFVYAWKTRVYCGNDHIDVVKIGMTSSEYEALVVSKRHEMPLDFNAFSRACCLGKSCSRILRVARRLNHQQKNFEVLGIFGTYTKETATELEKHLLHKLDPIDKNIMKKYYVNQEKSDGYSEFVTWSSELSIQQHVQNWTKTNKYPLAVANS